MRLALYEHDIHHNAGTLVRLAACLDIGIDIIEPCGFVFSEAGFRRAGMDYRDMAQVTRHASWQAFYDDHTRTNHGRLVLLTTKAPGSYIDFSFAPGDTLLLGRESAGVPDNVHATADARLRVPLKAGLRSLNVAVAGAMVLGEALRQTKGFPG